MVPGLNSIRGSLTKRMESESKVTLSSLGKNGKLMIKIVIDSRRSRRVISFAISTAVIKWLIPANGMKTSAVCFIANQPGMAIEKKNIDECCEKIVMLIALTDEGELVGYHLSTTCQW